MTREEAAKLGGVDPNAAGVEIRGTTQDQLVQMYDPLGNLNRSVVWFLGGPGRVVILDDATGLIVGEGGSGRGQRGVPTEPMLPQP